MLSKQCYLKDKLFTMTFGNLLDYCRRSSNPLLHLVSRTSNTPSCPKHPSRNLQPKALKRSWFQSLSIECQYSEALCGGRHTLVLEAHVFVSRRVCVGTRGQRDHYPCNVGGRVHGQTLEHLFSGALSYVQASFPGHMRSSMVRKSYADKCVAAVCVCWVGGVNICQL